MRPRRGGIDQWRRPGSEIEPMRDRDRDLFAERRRPGGEIEPMFAPPGGGGRGQGQGAGGVIRPSRPGSEVEPMGGTGQGGQAV